jgi:hypothetical protein
MCPAGLVEVGSIAAKSNKTLVDAVSSVIYHRRMAGAGRMLTVSGCPPNQGEDTLDNE